MDTTKEITRNEFDRIEAKYKEALQRRRFTIQRQKDGMSNVEIGRYWGLHGSRITRILEPQEKAGGNENTKRSD